MDQTIRGKASHVFSIGRFPGVILAVWLFGCLALLVSGVLAQPESGSLISQAQQALDRGQFEEAIPLLEQLRDQDEQNLPVRQALVDALMRLRRWDEAAAEMDSLRQDFPDQPRVAFLAAAVAFRMGQFEAAAARASEAIALDDSSPEIFRVRALSRFMSQDYEGYKADLYAILERDPNNAEAYYHLGRYHYEKQTFAESQEAFRKATELDPQFFKAHYFLGWCLQAAGDLEGAKGSYLEAIQIVQKAGINYGWPFTDLGDVLILQGQYDEGLVWLKRAIENDPKLPFSHFRYAGALLKKEATPEVESELRTAIQLDPGYPEAYYLLGTYYKRVGDREKAREALEKFQELRKNPTPSPFGVRRK
ncbi:MAG: tetratricopeptide repeat protein [Acidobacteriota bacterium]|nr:MAG: tetratricopeptide repeat protein [Acidobacteriota bacterium]